MANRFVQDDVKAENGKELGQASSGQENVWNEQKSKRSYNVSNEEEDCYGENI